MKSLYLNLYVNESEGRLTMHATSFSAFTIRGEMAAKTTSSQAPPAAFVSGICRAFASMFVPSHVLHNAANAPPVAGYRQHSTTLLCLSCLGRSDCISSIVNGTKSFP